MSGLRGSNPDHNDAGMSGPDPKAADGDIPDATDASFAQTKPRKRKQQSATKPASGPVITDANDPEQSHGAADPTESLILAPGDVGQTASRAKSGPPSGQRGHDSLRPARPHRAFGLGGADQAGASGFGDTWPYYDLSAYDHRRGRARKVAIGATVLGIGGLLFAAWLNQGRQAPRRDTSQPIVAVTKPAAVAPVGPLETIEPYGGTATAESVAGLTPEERAVLASDTSAASDSLGHWFGPAGTTPGTVGMPQALGNPDARQARSAAEPGPAEALAVATRRALAQGQTREAAVSAPAADTVVTPPAKTTALPARTGDTPIGAMAVASDAVTASPAPTVTRSDVRTVAATPSSRPISIPAQWIGGGPTDFDNRRGRYRGSVVVQFTIESEGRASDCTVVRPSGNSQLDALTCQIVTERARFTPARDAQGRYVASQAHATYSWGRGRRQQK